MRLMLEGKLSGAWVSEFERHYGAKKAVIGLKSLAIDLRNLTAADNDGRNLLARLQENGTVLENVHPLLASAWNTVTEGS